MSTPKKTAPAKTAAKRQRAPAKPKQPARPLTKWQAWSAKPDALDDLCLRIKDGDSLTQIARSMEAGRATLLDWIAADPDRSARVACARVAAAAAWDERAQSEIEAAMEPFELAKAKELAHHLRWRASKIAPREYGDKLQHGGADDLPPVQHRHDGQLELSPSEAYMRMIGRA